MSARTVEIRFLGSTKELEAALARVGVAAETVGKEIGDKMNGAATTGGNAFSRLGKQLEGFGLPLAGSFTKMGENISATDTKGKKFGATMQAVGKTALLGIAGAAVGIGAESLRMSAKFDAATNVFVTAAGESAKSLGLVRNGILNIAASTGTAIPNLTAGMYLVEKAGIRGASGLDVLKAAAQGAREENAQLSDVVNAMTSVMTSYHMPASKAVQVMNALKTAAGEGKMTMEDFSRSLSTVIPIAAANHLSLAQVSGAIATLTQHGTSADEATQELANTIRNLAAPSQTAQSEMQQLGLNVNNVEMGIGKRGLTGTLNLLVTAITSHMGPAGTVLLNAFKVSQSAGADLQVMLKAMPPKVRHLADEFMSGAMNMSKFRKAMPTNEQGMISQFATLYNKVHGFNDVLKSGQPASQTFTAALKTMMGGSTGLNTALQLTGGNMAGFQGRVVKVSKSLHDSSKSVEGWSSTSKLLAVQADKAKEAAAGLAIRIGEKLTPALEKVIAVTTKVVTWFEKHTAVAIALGGVIGGVLLVAIGAYTVAALAAAAATIAAQAPLLLVLAAAVLLGIGIGELATHWKTVMGTMERAAGHFAQMVIDDVIRPVVTKFLQFAYDIVEAAAKAFGWVPGIGGKLKSAANAILGFKNRATHDLNNWANDAKNAGTSYGSNLQQKIGAAIPATSAAAAKLAQSAGDAGTAAAGTAGTAVGQSFATGMANAIEGAIPSTSAAAAKLVQSARAAAMAAQNSHSPSREMMKVGGWFAQGYAIGIEQQGAAVQRSAAKMSTGAISAAGGGLTGRALTGNRASSPAAAGGQVVNYTVNIPVSGDMSPQTADRLRAMLDQQEQDLMRLLRQVAA